MVMRTTMRTLSAAVLVAFVLATQFGINAHSQSYEFQEGANAALRRRDYETAVRLLRPLAQQGNAWAQEKLGFLYSIGFGVIKNYAEAARLYKLAADQGNADGQNSLGLSYLYGKGVRQNDAEALRLFKLAADQGKAVARVNLGLLYEQGRGVVQNYPECPSGGFASLLNRLPIAEKSA